MPRLKPATLVDIHNIEECAPKVREIIAILKDAGAPRAVKAAQALLKSIDGAGRHAWRRYRNTNPPEA